MKVITLKTFKRIAWSIFGTISLVIIALAIFPLSIKISDTTINEKISEKIPMTVHKDIEIPLIKKSIPIDIHLLSLDTKMMGDTLDAKSSGFIDYKGNKIEFSTQTVVESLEYRPKTGQFFIIPQSNYISINYNDVENFRTVLIKSGKEKSKNRILNKGNTLLNKFHIKGNKEKVLNIANNITSKTIDGISNKLTTEKIVLIFEDKISAFIQNGMKKFPVYTLKDNDIGNSAKTFLMGIDIKDNHFIVKIGTANIMKIFIVFVVGFLIFMWIVYSIDTKVKKRGSFSFFDILEITLEASLEGLGNVAEGAGKVIGGIGEGLGNM